MRIEVRRAVLDDIAGIQSLARLAHIQTPGNVAQLRFFERVYSTESLTRSIQNRGAHLLVAINDDQIVGMCGFGSPLLDECEDRKEIHRLFVLPERAREGIGGRLIEGVVTALRDEPMVRRVSIYVNRHDAARLAFFKKYGFTHQPAEDQGSDYYLERQLDT